MNPKTLEALKGSILKWEKIVEGKIHDKGRNNCPLCTLFLEGPDCEGCPVSDHTKRGYCFSTPYYEYVEAHAQMFNDNPFGKPNEGPLKALAQAEVDFLKSLLPEEER